eukprot:CAMPEP_0113621760 /NCGR_PEP_ID=MMETSP0017_2-20120614/11132_1 /TAXON_ID=2856 /ORGANISM="Cylindrotheca closterium" /LENGTH=129 /DNA_ID=CAMNT_0000531537 /DNA_START=21 /DNA_END=407 /DNA_ORIENTATION=+ /assembly_acc=CAM_ASM_000147
MAAMGWFMPSRCSPSITLRELCSSLASFSDLESSVDSLLESEFLPYGICGVVARSSWIKGSSCVSSIEGLNSASSNRSSPNADGADLTEESDDEELESALELELESELDEDAESDLDSEPDASSSSIIV